MCGALAVNEGSAASAPAAGPTVGGVTACEGGRESSPPPIAGGAFGAEGRNAAGAKCANSSGGGLTGMLASGTLPTSPGGGRDLVSKAEKGRTAGVPLGCCLVAGGAFSGGRGRGSIPGSGLGPALTVGAGGALAGEAAGRDASPPALDLDAPGVGMSGHSSSRGGP